MTDQERSVYDQMPAAARRAIDACSDELKPIAIRAWAAREFDKPRKAPKGYVPWDQRPRRETVAPADFESPTENDRRYP